MTDRTPDVILPRRGVAARAIVFLLSVIVGLILYALVIRPLAPTHFLWLPEVKSQDLLLKLRPKPALHPDIVEVVLNNDRRRLVDNVGDPLGGRSVYASLIRRLSADGAKVIVLDTYLPNRTTREQDGALWRAMADTGKVFLPIKYDPAKGSRLSPADLLNQRELEYSVLHGRRTTVVPDAEMESYTWWQFVPPVFDFTRNAGGGRAAGVGMAVYQPDPDGVLRHIQYGYLTNLVYPAGLPPSNLQRQWAVSNVIVPSEVIPAALRMFGVTKDLVGVTLGQAVSLSGRLNPPSVLPIDEWARAPISFVGPPGVVPQVNAADVLDGKAAKGTFTGKLVVVGVMGPFTKADVMTTPVSPAHPRMDVTAQALNSLLTRKPLVRTTHLVFVPLLLLAIVAGLVIPAPWRVGRTVLAALAVLLVYLIVALVAAMMGVLLPVLSAVLLILIAWLLTMVATAMFPI